MLHHSIKAKSEGFSLLELLVAMVIIAIGLSAAIPSYLRNMRQGEVDRFASQLEAGIFGLRAKLGQQKTSCTLNFDQSGLTNFVPPADLLEMKDNSQRMECCNSDIEAAGVSSGCAYGPDIGALLAIGSSGDARSKIIRNRSLRLLDREGTPESQVVEVSVNLASYELTPPGTSTMSQDLFFLVRHKRSQEQRLRIRCVVLSSTGYLFRASWNSLNSSCEK